MTVTVAVAVAVAQFPSVSLLDWTSGNGNSRYWVLRLLLDNFAAGDAIVNTTVGMGTGCLVAPLAPGTAVVHTDMRTLAYMEQKLDRLVFLPAFMAFAVCKGKCALVSLCSDCVFAAHRRDRRTLSHC